ncbi:hypothetical protein A6V37_19505 [Paraburkholderia ginsengiterrae]|uniref:Uncharacterized protein n=1 Tax=Paraburkholderia ginsengiterrae TaxID=1462993 RepID=A0A1A9NBQ8_9BURK|nr:hypothetical protein A6V37_19505 [Paraburkholderia ginsengiterrae]
MGFLENKFAALSSGLTKSVVEAKSKAATLVDGVEVPIVLSDFTEIVTSKSRRCAVLGKGHAGKLIARC